MFANGLFETFQAGLLNELVFVLPLVIIDQVVLKTPEAHAISAEDIAGFESAPQRPIDKKLIAIRSQASLSTGIGLYNFEVGHFRISPFSNIPWEIMLIYSGLTLTQ